MVFIQKWPFFQILFFRQNRPGKCLFDILGRENAFLGYKKRSSKSRKIAIFPKGLTHGFGPKISIFSSFFFFFGNMGQENIFYDTLERRKRLSRAKKNGAGKCFLRYSSTKKRLSRTKKNQKFKKSKNCHFSKGVNPWFWSKNGPFST